MSALLRFCFCFFLFGTFVSCQSTPHSGFSKTENLELTNNRSIDSIDSNNSKKEKNTSIKHQVADQIIEEAKEYVSVKNVPIEQRSEVDMWIKYFTGRGREQMKLYLERSQRYIDLMRSVLKKQGLPENLVYVAMIESGFSPRARSRASAVGYWQFIESTGRRYGLKVDPFIDERMDPILSTRAAAQYLTDLYELFGSWHLAMAAYNAGEYRVNRAMMRHYTRDFWKLRKTRSIPKETRHYIPKFMAANFIAKNPKKYGFDDLKYKLPISFESVAVHKPVSLKKIAQALSLSYEDLKLLNPKYTGEYVPAGQNSTTVLRVPNGYSEKVTQEIIAQSFMNRPRYSKTYAYYKVRRGDTLYWLSRRNRTTINTIRRMNGLSKKSILRAGKVIKLPRCYNCSSSSSYHVAASSTYHKVRKGDSLGRVAKRYGIQVSELKKWNQISSHVIHPGQMLRVQSPSKNNILNVSHTIKKGESLKIIAQRYGVQVSKLKEWNQISSHIIHPGQVLKLKKANTSSKRTYVVKKGDTLISIAKKYRVPLMALMKKNSMNFKSVLGVGRTIVIP